MLGVGAYIAVTAVIGGVVIRFGLLAVSADGSHSNLEARVIRLNRKWAA